jgi:hypothetical protein
MSDPSDFGVPKRLFSRIGNMEPKRQAETAGFKRSAYDILRTMSTAKTKRREVRIIQFQPAIDWSIVWGSLHNVMLPDGARSACYTVSHIILTNVSLHRIQLKDTENCTQCGTQATILQGVSYVPYHPL